VKKFNSEKDTKIMKTPNLDKVQEVSDQSHQIGEFLEWLENNDIVLAQFHRPTQLPADCLMPLNKKIEEILADYFEIDLVQMEKEKCMLLEKLRDVAK